MPWALFFGRRRSGSAPYHSPPHRPAAPLMREAPTRVLACSGTSLASEDALKTSPPTPEPEPDALFTPKPAPLRGRPELSAYLQKILNARVYDVAVETALDPARSLSRRLGNHVLLKREDQQPVFSFKLRGAYNKMAQLPPRAVGAWRHLRLGRQPRAGGRAQRAQRLGCKAVIVMPVTTPRLKVGRRACAGRRGRAARRQLFRRLRACARTREGPGPELRAPFRRPGRDRRPGHHRDGDPASASGADRRGVRGHRRRRADLRRGRLHQGGAPADQGDRRADRRLRRDAALGARGQARGTEGRGALRRWHRRQTGGGGDLPPGARAGRRLRRRRHRRSLRRHQGRVPGHAQHPRALGRDGRGGTQAVRRNPQAQGQDLRRHHLRREHELRPAALRRRAGRVRRAA